ncbi:MAG TPA: GTPase Era [Candidatus Eremiobacteraeota bacterium]|nr:MAG: GTPase Era [bacterium ADurb.Bin363]HPZ10407.1 GTPase Era [Candidatus Eremiobacteraeota bacterium]
MNEFKSGFVTIIGLPNVGKSTLLNNLTGNKVSIVTPKPQTTRDNIRAILTTDTLQVVFIDTPGLHKGRDLLGKRMSRNILSAIEDVDIVLLLVDVTREMDGEDRFVIKWLSTNMKDPGEKDFKPVFLLLNKIDLLEDKKRLLPMIDSYKNLFPFKEIIPVSALKGENFSSLLEEIYKILSIGPAYYPSDEITDQGEDFFISELIREKILLFTHQEVPYSVAVRVTEITPKQDGNLLYISAVIYVEKDSQKGILIGKKGTMLKKIGTKARETIEFFLKKKIYLELSVKIKERWRSRENILKDWGYSL